MYTVCLPLQLAGLEGFCPQCVCHQALIRDQLETEKKHTHTYTNTRKTHTHAHTKNIMRGILDWT